MKKLFNFLLSFFLVSSILLLPSCKKDIAEKNPVTQLSFGSKTIPTNEQINLTLTGFNKAIIEKSMVLSYGEISGLWYQIPGWTSYAGTELRTYISAYDPSSIFWIRMISGTSAVTFDKIRVIIIPADILNTGRTGSLPFDTSNYESVRNYFNLPH